MQIRSDQTAVRNSAGPANRSRTVRLRDSVLGQLHQLGMNVEDDDLLAELDTFGEDELIAILGLFGLLGYFALLGLLGAREPEE
jgi:hypothetical protein